MFHYKYKKLQYNYHFLSLRKCKNLSKICYILIHEWQNNQIWEIGSVLGLILIFFFSCIFRPFFLCQTLNVRRYFLSKLFSWAVLSYGTVYYVLRRDYNFSPYGWNPWVLLFKWKLLCSTFKWQPLNMGSH